MLKSLIAAAAALAIALPTVQAQDKTGYVDHDGLHIYYEIHGSGEPFVLLHGAYMSARTAAPLAQLFAANRQVIVIELQGHGRTNDTNRPFSYEAMADDVAAVLDEIGISQADVFGYSMGGAAALQFAIRHPEKVRKLIAASAAVSDRGYHQELKDLLPHMSAEMFAGSPILTDYEELSPHPDKFPALVEKLVALDMAPFDWPHEQLAAIPAPTLLLFGDADVVTPEHQVEMFRAMGGGVHGDMLPALPKVQLAVLPGTTHLGVMFNHQLVHAVVETFLTTEARPPMAAAQ
jgi:pimeloyl-ACP methyl ester carboxylesterase